MNIPMYLIFLLTTNVHVVCIHMVTKPIQVSNEILAARWNLYELTSTSYPVHDHTVNCDQKSLSRCATLASRLKRGAARTLDPPCKKNGHHPILLVTV